MTGARSVLYLIVCAAPRARNASRLIGMLHGEGWDVCVVATPSAVEFFDVAEVEKLTGRPVRTHYKKPDESDLFPPADAVAVCPGTFNTINKWALGISDTLALGLLTEAVGMGLPVVAAPSLNDAQAAHPAFSRSVEQLREMGAVILFGPGVYEPAPPGTGGREFPWQVLLNALRSSRRNA
jgi:phosphopantothenoylcysteine decarboxylase